VSRRWVRAVLGAVAVASVGCVSFVLLAFRTCDQVRDTRRGSFDYRLCGVGSELIASIPIVAPANEPLYSWTLAEGTQPGRNVLKYESSKPPDTVRTTVEAFLRQAGFSESAAHDDYEWWTDHHTELGLSIRGARDGSRVEVLHNTGSD
jgi:hypothetical protein